MNRTAMIHKRWTAVIVAVLFVLLFATTIMLAGCDQTTDKESAFEPIVATVHNSGQMKLTSEVSASDNSVTVTAILDPKESTETELNWSLTWRNSASEWASGKEVGDYVTVSANGLSATLSCLQPFGEQMILTASTTYGVSNYATVDFEKRLDDIKIILKRDGSILDSVLYSQFADTTYSSDYFSSANGDLNINVDGTSDAHVYSVEVEGVFSDCTLDSSDNHHYSFSEPDLFETDSYVTLNENIDKIMSDLESYLYGDRNIEEYLESSLSYNSYVGGLNENDGDWVEELKSLLVLLSMQAAVPETWNEEAKSGFVESYEVVKPLLPRYLYNGDETAFSDTNTVSETIYVSGYGVEFVGPYQFHFSIDVNVNDIPLPVSEISFDNSSIVF